MSERYGFRTSFRGFSRQDVLAHIDEMRATYHEETAERDAEIEHLRQELDGVRAKLAEVSSAAEREEQLRSDLQAAEETVAQFKAQNEQLSAQIAQQQAALDASREQELLDELSEARAELQAIRERETTLNAQLAETHRAVAALWQDKEALERKLAAAGNFTDSLQTQLAELKVQMGGTPVAEEKPAEKSMERWLF